MRRDAKGEEPDQDRTAHHERERGIPRSEHVEESEHAAGVDHVGEREAGTEDRSGSESHQDVAHPLSLRSRGAQGRRQRSRSP